MSKPKIIKIVVGCATEDDVASLLRHITKWKDYNERQRILLTWQKETVS